MRRLMDGETVLVAVHTEGPADRLGNPGDSWAEPVAVDHVLVGRATADAAGGYLRPDGITVTVTLQFPRTCGLDLFRAKVTVRGEELLVSGRPAHVPSPLLWDMVVEAGVEDG